MTSILKEDDKIFTKYGQYKELIHKDAEKSGNFVYGVDQLASRLVIAHMLDHVVCLLKPLDLENIPPNVRKIKKAPKTLLELYSETSTSVSSEGKID